MARVLVTRPEPGATRTAAALAAAGHEPVVRPLMTMMCLPWAMPAGRFDAVMLTSAAAADCAGAEAADLHALPALCVGTATVRAAMAAGFGRAEVAGHDVAAVLEHASGQGLRRVLHLAGEDRTAVTVPDGVALDVVTVYRAALLPLVDADDPDAVMLFSVRSAAHFVREWGGRARRPLVVVVSENVAEAVGHGWRDVIVAGGPDDASMLAALADAGL